MSQKKFVNNTWINYFVFIITLNFLVSLNLFANFFKFFKCRLFNNNSRKSAENLWIMRNQNNEIIETNNWTRLLIFDDKTNFYFFNMFLYITSVVYCRTFLHFLSSLFNNFIKLILRIYSSSKSLIGLIWIRKKFSTTLHTQFNYLTLPVTPFKSID